MSEENKPKSCPWKTIGFFETFEEADKKRSALLGGNSPNDQVQAKIKRCGQGGKQFMVKARLNPKYDKPKSNKKDKKKGK